MDDWTQEEKLKKEGDTRTYYPNKPLAQTAANRGQEEYAGQGVYSAAAQFEPDHGFVAVLFAKENIPAAWDAGFEVNIEHLTTTKTPDDWFKGKKKAADPSGNLGASTTPSSGATGRVHAIIGELVEKGLVTSRADRAVAVGACTDAGINPSTAGTQWAKFAKLRGW